MRELISSSSAGSKGIKPDTYMAKIRKTVENSVTGSLSLSFLLMESPRGN